MGERRSRRRITMMMMMMMRMMMMMMIMMTTVIAGTCKQWYHSQHLMCTDHPHFYPCFALQIPR
tara:strand:- start:370 stop:561 length:192 start_codon:yes stop_codon:yes gene_type:complete